jgi:hypothetical protein
LKLELQGSTVQDLEDHMATVSAYVISINGLTADVLKSGRIEVREGEKI